ncbi:MAG: hypothetical protein CALGDGBN_00870 [Pseudomonadales bacterium]|nr:hypothetical protein [Pseudomonadales bacterium]
MTSPCAQPAGRPTRPSRIAHGAAATTLGWLLPGLQFPVPAAAAEIAGEAAPLPWGFAALAALFAALAGWLWLRLERERGHLRASAAEQHRLRTELEIFRTAVEHSPVSTLITGPDTAIRYVNPCLARITGFDSQELVGSTPSIFRSGKTPESTYASLWSALREGRAWDGELQNRRKSGELYWEEAHIVPVRDAAGTVQAYVGLKLDLSARKAAEDRLVQSERKFATILENLPCVVYQVQMNAATQKLRFHYINGRVDLYGLTAEQVLQNPAIMLEHTHPEDLERVIANTLEAGQRMEPCSSEFRVRRTDGQQIWVECRDVPSPLPDGSILWTGYTMDVTARHEAEQQMRASEEKFRTLVESANDIIYTLDPTGRVEYVSPNWSEILGHPVEEIVGRNYHELLHPDDLAPAREFLQRILSSGRKQGSVEYRVRRLDGAWIWHTANGAPIAGADGRPVGMLGIARDISERKESESRILHMAHYDALTDLPNRSLFLDRLQQALQLAARYQRSLALMFIDLDHFKPVNDTHGHAVGDRVLQEAARRMSDVLRGSDAVGRIGGDEFVVLLTETESACTALEVAAKIRDAIDAPMQIGDLELRISCSIGVAVYPEHGAGAPELFRNADLAMYRAKESGRDAIRLHSAEDAEPRARAAATG